MRLRVRCCVVLSALLVLLGAAQGKEGATYYVSAVTGDDRNDGLSPEKAWRTLDKINSAALQPGDSVLFRRGDTWRGQLKPQSGAEGAPITYAAYSEGDKPLIFGSVARNKPEDWLDEGANVWRTDGSTDEPLDRDVGNIIFDEGVSCGVKKWKREDLGKPGDYWYAGDTKQVFLYSDKNPAELHRSIELALTRHIVDEGGAAHVIYDSLALRYGAAHGFGGGSVQDLGIRNCDLSWIGGGHQFTNADGVPVRYGNGIEFWENARDIIVEGCRISEVYDAALTNQGSRDNRQINITYRDNVIWNCEYSFEYWNRGPESETRDIRFDHNICVNAGFGWGHAQRPDPNGRHLMFFENSAKTTSVHVCDNVFSTATHSGMWMTNDWTAALEMNRNCWHQPEGALMELPNVTYKATEFNAYQAQTGLDADSIVADPKFIDPARHDYRLAEGSPALRIFSVGAPTPAGP